MVDYVTPLHQLPGFLRNEIVAAVGSTNNLSVAQIISRYRAETQRLTTIKRSQQRHYSDVSGIFGEGPLGKAEMEALNVLVDSQAGNNSSIFVNLRARQVAESIPHLSRFSDVLVGLQAQAERAARQQAEEAARQQARRQAEEVARQQAQRQAEEAQRQEVAQQRARLEAEEAARQLSQREAEQATRRRAEKEAFLMFLPCVRQVATEQLLQQVKAQRSVVRKADGVVDAQGNAILWVPGPLLEAELEQARQQLGEDVDKAITEFADAMDFDAGVTAAEAVNAMLYGLRSNGLDMPVRRCLGPV